MKIKKQLIQYMPYLLIGLYASKIGQIWRLTPGTDISQKFLSLDIGAQTAFSSPLPSFNPLDLLLGLFLTAGLRLAVIARSKNAKKYRHNVEYGSARWGTPADIQPFIDAEFANNIILTQTERITISNRAKIPTNSRNNNVLIVGGSGSGKTWFWLMPNIMQCDGSIPCSFVVTDPKGSL